MDTIILKEVTKSFGEFQVVNGISLSVEPGKIFGLLGPNGAGKTTTIRMMLNIILPDSGSISVLGEQDLSKIKDYIGYLPEERGLYQKMKVIKLLEFLGELKGLTRKEAYIKGVEWLERVSLVDWKHHKLQDLSKGMQQKVQFIGTLLHDPEIIIFDEPFSGLDPINMDVLKNLIIDLKKKNKTVLFSTHVMEQAEKLCDHICLINKGEIVINGQLNDIKKKYGEDKIILELANGHNLNFNTFPMIETFRDFGNYYELTLKQNESSQNFLSSLVKHERVIITRYQTSASSLHEIFIEKVREINK